MARMILLVFSMAMTCFAGTSCRAFRPDFQDCPRDDSFTGRYLVVCKKGFEPKSCRNTPKNSEISQEYWAEYWNRRGCVVELPRFYVVDARKMRKELQVHCNVGLRLLSLGMYKHAREILSACLELVRWFPYNLNLDKDYECILGSAIEQCNRRLHLPVGSK